MMPIRDENPSGITPAVTYALIAINVLVFFWQLIYGLEESVYEYGFIPYLVQVDMEGSFYRFLTSMFLHGGFTHIFGNMLYLYIFGDNVEAAFGRVGYSIFYIASGFAASIAHMMFNLGSRIPAVGASGAISGVLGAYLVLYPNANIVTLVFYPYGFAATYKIRSVYYLGFWFIYQLIPAFLGETTGVAYWAHIGGFVLGVLVALPLRSKLRRRRRRVMPVPWYEEWRYEVYV
ncbi:MAG: rhomboid family intramembrane serine protease [Thermoproteota archaeon]|nr:MAG: rhomboid family intramembrane serine protease [Candidatus Korarchaeota archaeon]